MIFTLNLKSQLPTILKINIDNYGFKFKVKIIITNHGFKIKITINWNLIL